MQQVGEIAKNHVYKKEKGEEQHLKINVIPNNMEKYMACMLGKHLVFLDSFQFMSSNLDKLVCNLPRESFKYTLEEFTGKKFDLMPKMPLKRTSSSSSTTLVSAKPWKICEGE